MAKGKPVPFATTLFVRDHCLCLAVQQAARALARRFDDVLRPYSLTSGQFSLLMSLNRPLPPTMKDVAETLAMDRTTLTAALKPLSRRGLVSVKVDKTDRRSRRLILMAAGEAVLAAAVPVWKRTHAAIERALPHGADVLRRDLAALTAEPDAGRARPRPACGRKPDAPSAA
jgi:DNA-binding MarR family transcriptional regulator